MIELPWGPIYRDRIGHDVADMALQRDGHVLVIDLTLHESGQGGEEVLTVVASVKAEYVGAEKMQQHLVLPRAYSEGFRVGPRNMPEQHDRGIRFALPDEPRQEREVIVLDQYNRIVLACLAGDD